ncbi:hypothetical protein WJX82_003156 [Trebouxia sp. C0006]
MRGLSGLSDFLLRKAFKFALKRNLGKYLTSEIDPSQLDVQLGQGTIELRQLLLNCNELNEQLNSPYWEITAGFIGSVKATVPITTLSTDSCQAVVDEILLTIKPRSLHHPSVHGVSASAHMSGSNLLAADLEDQPVAQDIMTDGIMQIAGGIETIVQQLQLQATRATIRVELPSVSSPSGPPSLIMIHLDSITYSGESSPPLDAAVGQASALKLCKRVQFDGLQIELFEDIDDPIAAAEGENVASHMRSAEMQLAADLEGNGWFEPFEREAVNVFAGDRFESSSIGANDNRHVIICSSNGVGCSGQVAVRLTWHNLQQIHPHIAIDLDLNPLQLQLHPYHLPLLSKVAQCVSESSQHAQRDGGNAVSGGVSSAQQDAGFVAGARSYVESAILPNFEQLAQDVADQLSWNTTPDPVPDNSYSPFATPEHQSFGDLASSKGAEFHDAHSMMGSVRTTFNSFLSSTAASLGSSQHFQPASSSFSAYSQPPQTSSSPPQQGSPNLRAVPKSQKADPRANAAKPEEGPLGWEVTAQCGEVSLVLWYSEEEEDSRSDPDQDFAEPFSCDYRPRFCLETGDVTLHVTAANDAALQCDLTLYRLECAEHLPVSGQEAAPAAATLAEVTRVTELLPPSAHGIRPTPSFTGVSPLPVMHSLYSSTLSQLASSQYVSASSLHYVSASTSGASKFAAASAPQIQVWPVLCAGGGSRKSDGVTPSLILNMHLNPPASHGPPSSAASSRPTTRPSSGRSATSRSSTAHAATVGGGAEAAAVASVQLRPSTVWLSLPLLQRLQSFFEPLSNLPAAVTQDDRIAENLPPTRYGNGINSILEDFQEIQGTQNPSANPRTAGSSSLQIIVQASHVCAVILLPPSRLGMLSVPSCHGNSYMAVDLFASTASTAGDSQGSEPMLSIKTRPPGSARGYAPGPGQGAAPDIWEGDLAISRAKVYLVGNPSAQAGSSAGMPDLNMEAHCILDIVSPAQQPSSDSARAHSDFGTHVALSANVRVTPGMQPAHDISDLAWQGAHNHSGHSQQGAGPQASDSHLDNVHLQEAAMATSVMAIHVKAPQLHAKLCQADLVALLHLVGTLNAWQNESRLASATQQAESELDVAPMQVCFLMEGGMAITLQHVSQAADRAQDADCHIEAEDVRIFNVSSLGGVMDSGALSIHAEGVTLTGGQDRGCLLHCPASGSSSSSRITPSIQFRQVTRSFRLDTSRLVQSKPGQQAALANLEGVGSVSVIGATFATDSGDLSLPWLTDLASFFTVGGYEGGVEDASPAPTAMTWSVALQDVAVQSDVGIVEWHGVAGEGHLRVMDGVQEDAFKKGEGVPAASVFLEGGWFPPEQQDLESSIIEVDPEADQVAPRTLSGSAPAVNEDYICPSLPPSEVSEEWDGDPSSEEKGVWFGDPNNPSNNGPHMEEDYVQLPVPGKQGPHGSTTGRGAIGPLPASHPTPLSRLIFRDLKLLITLNQEEEQAGHVSQAEPNNGRLEVDLEGVSLQLDTFRPEGSPYAWRLAFSIHQLEVRDHVKKGNGKPPRWRRMLGHHFMARTPRDPAAVMLQVELEAVKPDGPGSTKEEEFRLSVALLPLRLRIDQNMVTFLQGFFTSPNPEHGTEEDEGKVTSASSTVQEPEGSPPFLQKVEIQAFSIVIDYQPRRLDAAALRSGSFVEVLNLVPWGGVQLDLPRVKASGLQGWGALGSAVGNAYLQDIASSQVHKFVVGVAPVRSLCRVGWAAKQLLSISADQLRNTTSSSSSSHSINNDVAFTRQLRRGVTTLARAVTLEALGLGASVAGGADFVLRGGSGSGSDHPAGLKEGLKQAAQGLSSGLETAASALVYSPVRSVKEGEGVGTAVVRAIRAAPGAIAAPASAAAAATRVTLLGMRNALDPDRYEERRR